MDAAREASVRASKGSAEGGAKSLTSAPAVKWTAVAILRPPARWASTELTANATRRTNFLTKRKNSARRKAFSIGAEKHGVNTFSQNEIEHFECCGDDVITFGEVSEEDIVALINEKNNSIVDSSSDMEEEQDEPWPSITDAKTF
ncbi:hypothetical protein AVEN_72626-1 [Araneus ventricosus]|uniref:Uncharacterized protein n=1 Tax=Araneus ventricosus TaxID=182803 RepID=A0A4Y2TLI3_ARAVE|nr:hypothetical protein AVEN_72626-1 [Araneus ventricosus]